MTFWAAIDGETYSWAAIPRNHEDDPRPGRPPIEELADMLGLCEELVGVGEWLRFARQIEPGWVRTVPNPDGSDDSWYAECEETDGGAMEAWCWNDR